MTKTMLGIGAVIVGLGFVGVANAADWCAPSGYSSYAWPRSGYSDYGYRSGYSDYGYRSYQPGHYDYVPGHYRRHGFHHDYVPPHTDYHIGHRRYEAAPTPYGTYLSPRHHHHR